MLVAFDAMRTAKLKTNANAIEDGALAGLNGENCAKKLAPHIVRVALGV
jgi:hypothetical protein